jgi:hypothetical protein
MLNSRNNKRVCKPIRPKPHAILGAGRLVCAIRKTGNGQTGAGFSFNLFRMGIRGRVEQRFSPVDLMDLIKLVRLLATTLADEAGLPQSQRRKLAKLAAILEPVIAGGA